MPGSGKSTLAKALTERLDGAWVNADTVREEYNDWDFSPDGRARQAARMKQISNDYVDMGRIAIADFVCPTQSLRDFFDADYVIWMDTIKESIYEDTNAVFQEVVADCIVTSFVSKEMMVELFDDIEKDMYIV